MSTAMRTFTCKTLRSSAAIYGLEQRAALSISARRFVGKESALGQEGRSAEIETHKEDALQKVKQGQAHWKDELASDSESIIKADRGEIDVSKDTIKEFQKETTKVVENTRKKSEAPAKKV